MDQYARKNGNTSALALTAGQVCYGASNGSIGQSLNLYWDSSNNRLGINNASPSHALHVTGAIRASSTIYAENSVQIGPNGGIDRVGNTLNIGELSTGVQVKSTSVRLRVTSGGVLDMGAAGGIVAYGDEFATKAFDLSSTRTKMYTNLLIGNNSSAGIDATSQNNLCLANTAVIPAAASDITYVGAYDLAAGRCSLAIRAEEPVNADAALASTHSFIVRINGSNYKIMLNGPV